MTTYAVHCGNGLSGAKVLDEDFASLNEAREAAQKLANEGYKLVIVVVSSDGDEWDCSVGLAAPGREGA